MSDRRSDPPDPPAPSRPRRSPAPPLPRRERARGAYLPFGLRTRLAVSLTVVVVLGVALVLYVSHHNTDSGPTNLNPSATVQANRDAQILEQQDQAPRSARLAAGLTPAAGLRRAIGARMSRLISTAALEGPLVHVGCRPDRARGPRKGFACRALAGHVSYPFLAVVDTYARRITFCKRDPPAVPSENVLISPRCRA